MSLGIENSRAEGYCVARIAELYVNDLDDIAGRAIPRGSFPSESLRTQQLIDLGPTATTRTGVLMVPHDGE
jgi:hypothetical protein